MIVFGFSTEEDGPRQVTSCSIAGFCRSYVYVQWAQMRSVLGDLLCCQKSKKKVCISCAAHSRPMYCGRRIPESCRGQRAAKVCSRNMQRATTSCRSFLVTRRADLPYQWRNSACGLVRCEPRAVSRVRNSDLSGGCVAASRAAMVALLKKL